MGARVLAITNVVGSSVDRAADKAIHTNAGPEIAVASTKAYTTQLSMLFMLALAFGEARGHLVPERARELRAAMRNLPEQAAQALAQEDVVNACASRFRGAHGALFLGRGAISNSPRRRAQAERGQLHPCPGLCRRRMKHGPIALVTPECPTVAVAVPSRVCDKMLSNMQEVRPRGPIIAVELR